MAILRIIFGVMLLVLAFASTLKQSIMLYKATKKWQPNHYMQLFVKDGILYFLAYVFLSPSIHYPSLPSHSPTHVALDHLQKKTNHYGLLGCYFTMSLWLGSKLALH